MGLLGFLSALFHPTPAEFIQRGFFKLEYPGRYGHNELLARWQEVISNDISLLPIGAIKQSSFFNHP